MRHLLLSLLAVTACSDGDPAPADLVTVAKCSFSGAERPTIEPGDVYLYVVADPAGDFYAVAGTAGQTEPLTSRTLAQSVTPLIPAHRSNDTRFDYGDDGHFIGLQWGGQIHTAIGTTAGSPSAYPQCTAWNVESP